MKKICLSIILCAPLLAVAQPKNVIVVVGAGMGYNHIQATQNFTGEAPAYSSFPQQAGIYTLPAMSQKITDDKELNNFDSHYHSLSAWSDLSYLDSAAIDFASAGTALATGRPTGTGALGLGIDSSLLVSVLQGIQSQSKYFGIVTNTAIANSSLAAFFAKVTDAQHKDSIIDQLAVSNIDLLFCAGHPEYDSAGVKLAEPDFTQWGTKSSWETLAQPYDITVIDGAAPEAAADLSSRKLLGVSRFSGLASGDNHRFLADIVPYALASLSANPNGFTAIVESRDIEFASRRGSKTDVIAEMQAFNKTVDTIISWIESNSSWDETALIVLGTYESGMLADVTFDRSKNNTTALRKVDSKVAAGEYNFTLNSTMNTNALTPFFAKGSGTDILKYYTDHTDHYREGYTSLPEVGRMIREIHQKPQYSVPQNIILVIGDGCGRNQIAATKYYYGVKPAFESFPVKSYVSTYPGRSMETKSLGGYNLSYSSDRAWGQKSFLYGYNNVTCSASSGLAMASGKKSYYYGMGLDLDFNALNTIAQHAKAQGKAAGLVTTETINNATPSIFASHNISRKNLGQISLEMLIESQLDVLIGSGHPDYDDNAELAAAPSYGVFGSKETWDAIKAGNTILPASSNSGWNTVQDINGDGVADAWQLVTEKEDFNQIKANTSINRLLGIPHVPITLQQKRSGDSTVVNLNNKNNVPHLSTLATAGLNVLNKNNKGFFAMIEAGAIDQSCHSNLKGRMLEETYDFFLTVDSVVKWIEANGGWEKNLLIVTADHETGLLTGEPVANDSIWKFYEIKDNGKGVMPGMVFNHKDHSNQLVNFYAKGAGAEIFNDYADEYDYFLGSYLTNTEIGESMFRLWDGTPGTIRNRPPFVVNRIPLQTAYVGEEFKLVIPQSAFGDSDDQGQFRFDVAIPKYFQSWLVYDKTTSTLSGTPTATDNASVTVSAYDGATTGAGLKVSSSFNLVVAASTSAENHTSSMEIYPNPVAPQQTLHFEADCPYVQLTDSNGKIVFETRNATSDNTIQIGSLPKGTYFLKCIGTTTDIQPIIIE